MNKKRRSELNEANELLGKALSIVSYACDEEQDCLDNMPENLENSENYSNMENAVDSLNDAISNIEDAQKHIDDAIA